VYSTVNLPIGGIALAIIAFILKPTPPQQGGLTILQQIGKLDLLGELCLLPSIVCLLLALQWGGSTYPWSDPRIIALFVVFALLALAFILVQILMPKTATIPASVLKSRSMLAGMWLTFCIASAMLTFTYFLPTWFQAIKGTSAVQSGIDTIPMVLALVVGNISAGQITGRIGYYTRKPMPRPSSSPSARGSSRPSPPPPPPRLGSATKSSSVSASASACNKATSRRKPC